MRPDEIEDRDPGLARERTSLAWTRTALSFAAVGVAILKRNVPIGAAVLSMSPLIWASGRLQGKSAVARPRRLVLITGAVVAVALAALVVAFLAPGPHHAG